MIPRQARRTTRRIATARQIPAAREPWLATLLATALLSACGSPGEPGAQLREARDAAVREPISDAVTDALSGPRRAQPLVLALDGAWEVWLDPQDAGLAGGWVAELTAGRAPAGSPGAPVLLAVPGPLEGSAATRAYDGVAFYLRDLVVPEEARGALVALRFGQVNWGCRAWLDGEELGSHEGGYDAFELDLTGRAAPGAHRLVLRVTDPGATPVDGVTLKTTPHAKESWYENFGGVLGPVALRIEPALRIAPEPGLVDGAVVVDDAASALTVRGTLELAPSRAAQAEVALSIEVDGVERLSLRVVPRAGRARIDARVELPGAARWSPERPVLHAVRVVSRDAGVPRVLLARDVGFRTLELRDGDLLIDGVRRVLKGVLWQPHFTGTGGTTPPDAELEAEARAIRDTGFNLVRAHVRPAPPAFLDACDRLGLLVLEEPAIGWVDDDPALLPRLLRELDWMVARDGHHPSIILWGMLNELSGKAYRHGDALVEHLAALDASRPILQDSGGFFGDGRVLPPRPSATAATAATAADLVPMLDRHEYPPYPLPLEDRDRLQSLGAPERLAFVSEFGYGTLPDCAAAFAEFQARGLTGDESLRFRTSASVERRAAAAGATWTATHWRAEADRNQADAAEELVEALRANPAVDLLCYTQWRAVSMECSAGVLAPWGAERPVRARLRHALRPLMAVLLPARLAVEAGGELACAVAVVNDTGATVSGRLALLAGAAQAAGEGAAPAMEFPPGVTRVERRVKAPDGASELELLAALRLDDGTVETSSMRRIAVVAPPAPDAPNASTEPTEPDQPDQPDEPDEPGEPDEPDEWQAPVVWQPGDEPAALAAADVALVARPERLGEELSLDAQLALWRWIGAGGSAVVLLRNPGEAPLGDLLGLSRGVETLAALPLRAPVGSAPGNFMARLFLRRDDGHVTALGRDDALLSPRAMLLGELPAGAKEHVLAVGHLGNRIGAPDASMPFGRGTLRFVGLPLRAVPGETEPLRAHVLAELLAATAERSAARRVEEATPDEDATQRSAAAPFASAAPLDAEERAALEPRLAAIARLAAFGDRASPWLSGGGVPHPPAAIEAALALHDRALLALLDGDASGALALLDEALHGARWERGAQRFLAAESDVLDGLSRRVAAAAPADWDAAYDAAELWIAAIAAWFAAGADAPGDKEGAGGAADAGDAGDADGAAGAADAGGAREADDAGAVPGLDHLLAARERLARS
jgi:hypothetical protein